MTHWREAMRPVRFFMVDARAAVLVFLVIVRFRIWTLVLMVVGLAVFWWLERQQRSPVTALRMLRSWLVGGQRPALVTSWRRKMG